MIIIHLPLRIKMGVKKIKKYTIAMNQYRNRHYQVSNNLKKLYKEEVAKEMKWVGKISTPIDIVFIYRNPTKSRSDLENFCAIHNKFLQDALVELWYIEDDSYVYINSISYIYGWYKKNIETIEVIIKSLST